MSKKSKFIRPEGKNDFIGHIVFPFSLEVRDLFFRKAGKKNIYGMYWKGELIDRVCYSGSLLELLESSGYKFKLLDTVGSSNPSKATFDNIPIYANIEYGNNSKNESPSEIVVSYHAQDIIEVGARGKHILNKVLDLTGISGHGTMYGKNLGC